MFPQIAGIKPCAALVIMAALLPAGASAQVGCSPGKSCLIIGPVEQTPQKLERARREAAEARAREEQIRQGQAERQRNLAAQRAAEARRLAAARGESEQANAQQRARLDALRAKMTPQQRANADRCQRMAQDNRPRQPGDSPRATCR